MFGPVTLTLVDVGTVRRWREAWLIAQCYGGRGASRLYKDAGMYGCLSGMIFVLAIQNKTV